MARPAAQLRDLVAATKPRRRDDADASLPPWTRPNLAGRLVELSGGPASATLTFAVQLVLDAQRRGETSAWVTSREASFHPPDADANGVDLAALPVVRVPAAEHVPRAAERLVRCGAFDLVVLDLGKATVPLPLVTRLQGLAERHDAAVLFVTEKGEDAPSVSSLISLRVEARRARRDNVPVGAGFKPAPAAQPPHAVSFRASGAGAGLRPAPTGKDDRCFVAELTPLRDKRRPFGWSLTEQFDAPPGLLHR
jgi:recombination protein RecA